MNGLRRISNGHHATGFSQRTQAWTLESFHSNCVVLENHPVLLCHKFPICKHVLTCEKVIGGQCLTKWLRHGAQAALSFKTRIYFILYPSSSVMYTCLIHVSAFSVRYYYKSENVDTYNPTEAEAGGYQV